MDRRQRTWKEPTHTGKEHVNATQKGSGYFFLIGVAFPTNMIKSPEILRIPIYSSFKNHIRTNPNVSPVLEFSLKILVHGLCFHTGGPLVVAV